MRRNGEILRAGEYEVRLFPEKTARCYEALPKGEGVWARYLSYLLPRIPRETAVLWDTLGVDPEKFFSVHPLSEPDERGEILFLCVTGICGLLLSGGEGHPRQSAELGGVSLIFVKAREEFDSARPALEEPELELRFVISLPFDAEYFSSLEQ